MMMFADYSVIKSFDEPLVVCYFYDPLADNDIRDSFLSYCVYPLKGLMEMARYL